MARKNESQNEWFDECDRNADRLVKGLRRETDRRSIPMRERQTGSHRITRFDATSSTKAGSIPIPMEREIARGTWESIRKRLIALGILFTMALCLIGSLL